MKIPRIILLLMLPVPGLAQDHMRPMNIVPVLAGNFAEMRSGHFHAGLDFKTDNREGIPVTAAADGVVTRMVVNPEGYGHALYMEHADGKTTVYAHLGAFEPSMEKFLNERRYALKSDKADITPPAGRFKFRRGELIGYSGNTGSSAGPHLHFEVRESTSQAILNPLVKGFVKIKDTRVPELFRLYYVRVDTLCGVPVNSLPREIAWRAWDGPVAVAGCGYFVAEAIDRQDGTANRMGVYRIAQYVDGGMTIEIRRDRFLFSDGRYVNAVAHYALNRATPNEMIRMAVMEGNKMPFYHNVRNRGALLLADTLPHTVTIELQDEAGNISRTEFSVRRTDDPVYAATIPPGAPVVSCGRPFVYSGGEAGTDMSAGVLYEPAFYTQNAGTNAPRGAFSVVHTFMNADVPLHDYITVWIKADLPQRLRDKACLARVSTDGGLSYAGGYYAEAAGALPARVAARVRNFGGYCIVADTLPPSVTPLFKSGASLAGRNEVSFKVRDGLSGVKSYRGTMDGVWVLMEYDMMKGVLTHYFGKAPQAIAAGGHAVTLEVTDNKGNTTTWSGRFAR